MLLQLRAILRKALFGTAVFLRLSLDMCLTRRMSLLNLRIIRIFLTDMRTVIR